MKVHTHSTPAELLRAEMHLEDNPGQLAFSLLELRAINKLVVGIRLGGRTNYYDAAEARQIASLLTEMADRCEGKVK